jgi:MFS family permease
MVAGIVASVGTWVVVLASDLASIYVGGAVIGAATGIFFASNWALGTSLVPKSEAGRYLGISNLAGAGAGAIGAYIGGPIADFFTINSPGTPGLGYVVLFTIYGIFFLFSSLALVKVNESPKKGFVE